MRSTKKTKTDSKKKKKLSLEDLKKIKGGKAADGSEMWSDDKYGTSESYSVMKCPT